MTAITAAGVGVADRVERMLSPPRTAWAALVHMLVMIGLLVIPVAVGCLF